MIKSFILLATIAFVPNLLLGQEDDEFKIDWVTAPTNGGLEFLNEGSGPKSIEQLREMEQVFGEISKNVATSTVNIQVGEAQGSGVVVSRDGFILTAAHVISRPNLEAKITFSDGSTANARTLGVNRKFDSGILKIVDEGKWDFLDIGESSPLTKGQWVVAIGHPGGLTEGRGLVYRAGRIVDINDAFITTDCALVGGDSGGPLVDLNGYVIGIHSRIGGQLIENFHVPVDIFSVEWDELVDAVVVGSKRAYLGISMDRTETDKILVDNVEKYDAAGKAGMKAGDIIIQIGDDKTERSADLRRALRKLKPEDKVKIRVKRGEEEVELDVTLGYG